MARIIISVSSLLLLHATLLASEAGGLSFLNIPTSALSASLGSTTTADLGRPSALIQNPANIWQFKRFAISFSDRSLLGGIQGIKYHNVFFGFRVKQLALGLGCLYYSVDNIEQYDDQAVYLGNFSFQNVAIPFGFSLKTSGLLWGVGFSYITQNFSNIGYTKETFFAGDIGVTATDLLPKSNRYDLTVSYVNKMLFSKTPKVALVNSASSNSILGFKGLLRNNIFSTALFLDLLVNPSINIRNMRLAGQLQAKYGETKVGINAGVNSLPLYQAAEVTYGDLSKYSMKKSFGFYFDLKQRVVINFAYEWHPILENNQYISMQLSF